MKIITSIFLMLVVLSIGCFDGDRGILTELLVEPAAAPPVQVLEPLSAEIAVGTGRELVMSPIPVAIEDQLYGRSWEDALDRLAETLRIPEVKPDAVEHFCDVDVHRRVFYDKYIDAGGIAIIGPSDRTSNAGSLYSLGVADEFLYAAREIILTMTSEMPALREVLSLGHEFGFRYVLIGADWSMDVNMPRELRPHSNYAGYFTGIGRGWLAAGGIYFRFNRFNNVEEIFNSSTVVHEMAHAIDEAFDQHPHLFPDWGTRLKTAYTLAYQNALQGKGYFDPGDDALTNEQEYWAVGAKVWFTGSAAWYTESDVGDRNYDVRRAEMRAELLEQDPLLYALLDEVFPVANFPQAIRIMEVD